MKCILTESIVFTFIDICENDCHKEISQEIDVKNKLTSLYMILPLYSNHRLQNYTKIYLLKSLNESSISKLKYLYKTLIFPIMKMFHAI